MTDFNCVKCGSDNTQIVRGIFESGTEAKYKGRADFTKTPSISELLALDENVTIVSQSRQAKRLSGIKLNKYLKSNLEDFMKSPNSYKEFKKELNEKQKKLANLKRENPVITKNNETKEEKNIFKKIPKKYLLSLILFLGVISIINFDIFIIILIFFVLIVLVPYAMILQWKAYYFFYKGFLGLFSNDKDNNLEIQKEIKKLESHVKKLNYQVRKFEYEAIENKKISNNENNLQKEKENQEKIKIWSNLYYCHRCDTVMDLDSRFHEKPENINELVEKLYQNQNSS